jgi:hypothetical protein
MSYKIFSVYFASFGFLLLSIIGLLRGQELMVCLQRGLAGLVIFWFLGMIFGIIVTNIYHDNTQPPSEH